MSRPTFIVDIRRHRGNSNPLIGAVGRYCSAQGAVVVEWLVRPDQAHLLQGLPVIGQADPFDSSWVTRVCERVVQFSYDTQKGGPNGDRLWVLTYDNMLIARVHLLKEQGNPVEAVHFAELKNAGISTYRQFAESSAPYASPNTSVSPSNTRFVPPALDVRSLTVEEALQLALEVLRRGGHASPQTALPQKELRPLMTRLDPRAAKRLGDQASEALIHNLVDRGLQEGCLKRFRRVPEKTGTEAMYLVEESFTAGSRAPDREPPVPESVPADSVLNETPQDLSSEKALHTAAAASSHSDTATNTNTSSPTGSAETSAVVSADSVAGKRRKHPNRASDDFEPILSGARIGSIPETRDRLFDALAALFGDSERKPILITDLFTKASGLAQEKANNEGYVQERKWPIAVRCIRRLMLRAGVLVGEDNAPLTDTIGVNTKHVASLDSDFRTKCEALLVEQIIDKAGGINYDDDLFYVGLTLFRRGIEKPVSPDELIARTDFILQSLGDRIEMDDDRQVRIKAPRRLIAVKK
jgi:hypothetical protein